MTIMSYLFFYLWIFTIFCQKVIVWRILGECMGKIAILIMAHKPIKYFEGLARDNQQVNFFVHMDIKTNFVNPEIKNNTIGV